MVIASISTFINIVRRLEQDRQYFYAFRGHSKENYDLLPSVFRKNGIIKKEDFLFKELLSHNPDEFKDCHYAIEYLVKMQHYGLPTRLLDLTINPLVALYFAVSENLEDTGEVIFFRIPKKEVKYYDSDNVSVISNLAKMNINFRYKKFENIIDEKEQKKQFNYQEHIGLLHHQIGFEKPHFQKCIEPNGIDQVICVKPKLNNPRIINQAGLFLLFGCGITKRIIPKINPDWMVFKNTNEKLIISNKKKIIKELELFGITNTYVYPEMDKFSRKLVSDLFE